eukprot:4496285-Prymnesium_polylepis.1
MLASGCPVPLSQTVFTPGGLGGGLTFFLWCVWPFFFVPRTPSTETYSHHPPQAINHAARDAQPRPPARRRKEG